MLEGKDHINSTSTGSKVAQWFLINIIYNMFDNPVKSGKILQAIDRIDIQQCWIKASLKSSGCGTRPTVQLFMMNNLFRWKHKCDSLPPTILYLLQAMVKGFGVFPFCNLLNWLPSFLHLSQSTFYFAYAFIVIIFILNEFLLFIHTLWNPCILSISCLTSMFLSSNHSWCSSQDIQERLQMQSMLNHVKPSKIILHHHWYQHCRVQCPTWQKTHTDCQ